MVVFGGQPLDLGFNFGSSTGMNAITGTDCSNTNPRDVTVVFEHPINNNVFAASALDSATLATAFLGVDAGLSASKDPKNCLCNVSSSEPVLCDPNTSSPCVFSAMAHVAAGGGCNAASGTIENQVTKLTAAYGARH